MATAPLPALRAISPLKEMGAYEALWANPKTTFASLAAKFRDNPDYLPSDFVPEHEASYFADIVRSMLRDARITKFGVRVHRAGEYPERLRDAEDPVELLYYRGWWDLVETPSVAVVGTRKPSPQGVRNAGRLVKLLVRDGFTVVSGLARGIDAAAHEAAINAQGKTIAVIGTPLNRVYPKQNAELQERIATDFLLISQVPVYRYSKQTWVRNRAFFPERNKTMSALTEATIIVEAGPTSGTLIQARAALRQRRKLFILEASFQNPALTWPREFEALGAIRVRKYEQPPAPEPPYDPGAEERLRREAEAQQLKSSRARYCCATCRVDACRRSRPKPPQTEKAARKRRKDAKYSSHSERQRANYARHRYLLPQPIKDYLAMRATRPGVAVKRVSEPA
jgi:DNA processing protein